MNDVIINYQEVLTRRTALIIIPLLIDNYPKRSPVLSINLGGVNDKLHCLFNSFTR